MNNTKDQVNQTEDELKKIQIHLLKLRDELNKLTDKELLELLIYGMVNLGQNTSKIQNELTEAKKDFYTIEIGLTTIFERITGEKISALDDFEKLKEINTNPNPKVDNKESSMYR